MSACLACGSANVTPFLKLPDVPVFCNVLHETKESALAAARGDLDLGICGDCGHVFNLAFDEKLVEYAEGYENSLHHSPRFQAYAEELAADLRQRHDLPGSRIVEIACGQGDFLALACADDCEGVGFDPSFRGEPAAPGLEIRAEYFGVSPFGGRVDLLACRHALEHIDAPVPFLEQVKAAVPVGSDPVVFFEVPNSLWSLRDGGVWDFIYEHVSYFNARSMTACFERAGYAVRRTWETFGGQFLCLEAGPGEGGPDLDAVPPSPDLVGMARGLDTELRGLLERWGSRLADISAAGGRTAVWGTGSKGVTFLNLLGDAADGAVPVDINPQKRGLFVAGTGHEVAAPEDLPGRDIALVLVMNPVYTSEITDMVRAQGLDAEVVGV